MNAVTPKLVLFAVLLGGAALGAMLQLVRQTFVRRTLVLLLAVLPALWLALLAVRSRPAPDASAAALVGLFGWALWALAVMLGYREARRLRARDSRRRPKQP